MSAQRSRQGLSPSSDGCDGWNSTWMLSLFGCFGSVQWSCSSSSTGPLYRREKLNQAPETAQPRAMWRRTRTSRWLLSSTSPP